LANGVADLPKRSCSAKSARLCVSLEFMVRLVVDNLPSGGRTVAFSASDVWARAATADALECEPTALAGQAVLSPPGPRGRLDVQLRARATGERACDRCGEAVEVTVEVDDTLVYLPQAPAAASTRPGAAAATDDSDAGGDALTEAELELGWYSEGEIDLGDVLREALALGLPSRVLCVDAAACNARTSGLLGAPPATSPFAALAHLSAKGGKSDA